MTEIWAVIRFKVAKKGWFPRNWPKPNKDTVGEPISMPKADPSARDFPSSLYSKKLYTG
jgi:hypothetical protein